MVLRQVRPFPGALLTSYLSRVGFTSALDFQPWRLDAGRYCVMTETKSCLCFDFDGTIADSLELFVEKIYDLAPAFGYTPAKKDAGERLRKKNPARIFESLNIQKEILSLLADRLRTEIAKEIDRLTPFKGIPETLETLKDHGHLLGLVSSNSEENVKTFLSTYRLDVFDFFVCGCPLSGKPEVLKKLLRERHIKPDDMVYIGDEVRDAEAARQAGVRFGAVTWGFSTPESLSAYRPDYVFKKAEDIASMLMVSPILLKNKGAPSKA